MNEQMNKQKSEKKPYVKPVLKQIELKTNEVLDIKCNQPGPCDSSFSTNS